MSLSSRSRWCNCAMAVQGRWWIDGLSSVNTWLEMWSRCDVEVGTRDGDGGGDGDGDGDGDVTVRMIRRMQGDLLMSERSVRDGGGGLVGALRGLRWECM